MPVLGRSLAWQTAGRSAFLVGTAAEQETRGTGRVNQRVIGRLVRSRRRARRELSPQSGARAPVASRRPVGCRGRGPGGQRPPNFEFHQQRRAFGASNNPLWRGSSRGAAGPRSRIQVLADRCAHSCRASEHQHGCVQHPRPMHGESDDRWSSTCAGRSLAFVESDEAEWLQNCAAAGILPPGCCTRRSLRKRMARRSRSLAKCVAAYGCALPGRKGREIRIR